QVAPEQVPLVTEWLSVSQTQWTVSPTWIVSCAGEKVMELLAGPTCTVTVLGTSRPSRGRTSGRYPRAVRRLETGVGFGRRHHRDVNMGSPLRRCLRTGHGPPVLKEEWRGRRRSAIFRAGRACHGDAQAGWASAVWIRYPNSLPP